MSSPQTFRPHFSIGITADAVVFTVASKGLSALLIRRLISPYKGSWALPGGFIKKNESARDAARRVLKEKARVRNVYMEQLYTFDHPQRDPRGRIVSVAYVALVPREKIELQKMSGTGESKFFPVSKLPPLVFDHKKVITYAATRLRSKLEYTNVVYSLLPREFTFHELRTVYEAILGRKLDKRNFIKKFKALGLIKSTKHFKTGERQRPAKLYTFKSHSPAELKKFF